MILGSESLPTYYVVAFIAASTGLIFWNAFERKKLVSEVAPLLLACGLVGMFASLASIQGSAGDRLFLIARDLLLQASIAYGIRQLSQRPKLLFAALVVVGAAYTYYYKNVQEEALDSIWSEGMHSNSSTVTSSNSTIPTLVNQPIKLDERAELLTDAQTAKDISDAFSDLVIVSPAFQLPVSGSTRSELSEMVSIDVLSDRPADIQKVRDYLSEKGWVEDNEQLFVEPIVASETNAQQLVGPSPSEIGLNDPEVVRQWAFSAWPYAAFAKTSNGLRNELKPSTLFVLDSGVDGGHPDLSKNYQAYGKENDRDAIGHGTHVAGIAAGVANNSIGIAGWFPSGDHPIKVSSIRVIGPFGSATQQAVVQGIIDASDAGASVINLSLGGPSNDQRQRVYQRAVEYANSKGCIVVAAAGNSSYDARYYSPANTPGILTVAALDNELNQASFSNSIENIEYGVWAPGKDIFSTVPNGGYTMFSGTSMAAPQVAGLLTVAKAINPDLSTRQAYQLLRNTIQSSPQSERSGVEVINPGGFLEAVKRG